MMSDISQIRELIEIARDGADLYDSVQTKVGDTRLRRVFTGMARCKRELIAALSDHLTVAGRHVPTGGTVGGGLRKLVAGVLAALARDNDRIYVDRLKRAEDRLLNQMESAIQNVRNPAVRGRLQDYLPRVRACHEEMSRIALAWGRGAPVP
ncbi:MAG: PA2169 family four-helix-bundle protein [Gammaproteobacteria bacterium]|nr:PA2169 family four-helix-bundle protein [Gammaproteobacteria bacterium]